MSPVKGQMTWLHGEAAIRFDPWKGFLRATASGNATTTRTDTWGYSLCWMTDISHCCITVLYIDRKSQAYGEQFCIARSNCTADCKSRWRRRSQSYVFCTVHLYLVWIWDCICHQSHNQNSMMCAVAIFYETNYSRSTYRMTAFQTEIPFGAEQERHTNISQSGCKSSAGDIQNGWCDCGVAKRHFLSYANDKLDDSTVRRSTSRWKNMHSARFWGVHAKKALSKEVGGPFDSFKNSWAVEKTSHHKCCSTNRAPCRL